MRFKTFDGVSGNCRGFQVGFRRVSEAFQDYSGHFIEIQSGFKCFTRFQNSLRVEIQNLNFRVFYQAFRKLGGGGGLREVFWGFGGLHKLSPHVASL